MAEEPRDPSKTGIEGAGSPSAPPDDAPPAGARANDGDPESGEGEGAGEGKGRTDWKALALSQKSDVELMHALRQSGVLAHPQVQAYLNGQPATDTPSPAPGPKDDEADAQLERALQKAVDDRDPVAIDHVREKQRRREFEADTVAAIALGRLPQEKQGPVWQVYKKLRQEVGPKVDISFAELAYDGYVSRQGAAGAKPGAAGETPIPKEPPEKPTPPSPPPASVDLPTAKGVEMVEAVFDDQVKELKRSGDYAGARALQNRVVSVSGGKVKLAPLAGARR